MPDDDTADEGEPYEELRRGSCICTEMYTMKRVNMHISWPRSMAIHLFIRLMIRHVATGQGTIAMEIVQELPTVDYILVPIGGGGLASGVATLAKMLNPKIKVIGVEPAEAASLHESVAGAQARSYNA